MKKSFAKNRIIAFILTLAMIATMIPTYIFPTVADDGTQKNEKNFDVDGFKGADPTMLICPDRETTVTLSLPSAEYQNAVDIVFAMDSSSSAQNSAVFTASVNALFESIIEHNPNIVLKVGVIRFRGRAHDAIDYLSNGAYSGLTVYNDASSDYINSALNMSEADIKAAFGSGSSTHAGIDIANEWLSADKEVNDDHKYLILLTDGKTYIWNNEEHEPTTIYAQYYRWTSGKGSGVIQYEGKASLNQNIGYNKQSYSVDVLDPTGKSNIFYFETIEELLASESVELTGISPWDEYCRYADTGEVPKGSAVSHTITNGEELFGANGSVYKNGNDYQYWYEFIPDAGWTGVKYLEANPFMVIDNGDGTYTFDTEHINPNYYQYHVDPLQKGIYKAGKLWEKLNEKYNCAAITYDKDLNLALLFNEWLRKNSKYGADIENSSNVQALFEGIDNDIQYMVSRGVVTDVIGDDFSLLNTDSAECFKMTLNNEDLSVNFADGIWYFGTPDTEGTYPYAVSYASAAKTITWTINVPVENIKPITLSYDLKLREDAATGYYDTNKSAVLAYKSTDGTKDGTYTFEVPEVCFICPGNNPPSEFDVDGSKVAFPTSLVCPDRETTVTLSLPSAEYQNAVDIVFVTDSSSSTDLGTQFIEASTKLFENIIEKNRGVTLKIGVVLFTGSANDAVSYVSEGAYSGLTVYNEDTKNIFTEVFKISETLTKNEFRNAFGRGSGPHSGLDMANMWLEADEDVTDDHKYVILFTDGKGYIWANENHEATTIYAQYYTSNKYQLANGGLPTLSQTMGYNKQSYSVDVLDKTGKSNIFWFPTYEALYNSTNEELTGVTKWDQPCLYAYGNTWEVGQPAGTVVKHDVTNGAELFGSGSSTYGSHDHYQYWFEFTPNDTWNGITYQEANPFEVIKNEDGTYTFDVNTVNPDYYQYHVDCLQKGLYKTGHLWTEMGKKYNQAVITYDSSTGGGLELVEPFKQWLRDNSDFSASKSDVTQVQALFNDIDNSIRYMVSRGVVADMIGDDFSLQNTDKDTCFRMTLNGTPLAVTFTDGVWYFGKPDAEGTYPYTVEYNAKRKLITWTINVPVENLKPITLSYDLVLRSDAPTGFYDTNEWAILNYKSTDGEKDGSYVFEIPEVSFICPGNTIPGEFDVDGSKVASPTELACPNRQTTVTLSLPSAEYQNAIDIVFAMDSSSSAQNSAVFTASVNALFESIIENNPNIVLKVGVIRFRGRAHDAIEYLSDGAYSGLTVYNDASSDYINSALNMSEADIKAAFGSGSNTHGGIDIANEWLRSDTEVDDDHKYLVLLTDGKTYIWNNEEHEPTTIYAQFYRSNSYTMQNSGKPALNQQIGYNKYDYSVDVLDPTGKGNVFVFRTIEELLASESTELTGISPWDEYCRYADTKAVPDGTVVKHSVTNGYELFGSNSATYGKRTDYQFWYEFTPNTNWAGVKYLEANPFMVIDNGDGTYTFDTENINPNYYQYHVDPLQKGIYKAAMLWEEVNKKYNCAVITYDGGERGGLEFTLLFNEWLRGNSKYGADITNSSNVQALFSDIDNSIRYLVSRGIVADVIGDDFSLLNTDKDSCFRMTLSGTPLAVTFTDDVWYFGTPDAEGVYPYVVEYNARRKLITWTINVPVENAKPITLSYDLLLREDAETNFYDTNEWAILNYKSTDGEHDGSYVFEVPVVSYIDCIEIPVEKIWDDSDDQYGVRPDFVTVVLSDEDGNEWELVLNENGEWKGTFRHDIDADVHIPDSKLVNGKFVPIAYSLKELAVYGYECSITGSAQNGFTIKNTLITSDLTITKTVEGEANCDRVFVFKVTGANDNDYVQIVSIIGNGAVTLKDMLFGKYTVTELTEWSYDYDAVGSAVLEADLTTGAKTVTVAFTNKADNTNWLRDEAVSTNVFTGYTPIILQ